MMVWSKQRSCLGLRSLQRCQQGLSNRKAASSLGVSAGKVSETWVRSKLLNLGWSAIEQLSDDDLEEKLFGPRLARRSGRAEPDPKWIHRELRRTGVTLELLHLEYLEQHPEGYRYSAFCDRYKRWLQAKPVVMRQVHKAGEKTFIDYSGKKPSIVDRGTGEVREVELFVAALGASSYTYAEVTLTQQLPESPSDSPPAGCQATHIRGVRRRCRG